MALCPLTAAVRRRWANHRSLQGGTGPLGIGVNKQPTHKLAKPNVYRVKYQAIFYRHR